MPERPYPEGLEAIFAVAGRLRAPGGCPWDREQTHRSLRSYLLEETYEVLEAIDRGDDVKLREELGDLLLQVAMHSAIAAERGAFDAKDVSEAAAAKIVARHPHVYAGEEVAGAEEVLRNWEHRKAEEAHRSGRESETPVDRVPATMPALAWTYNMQKRAARVGVDLGTAEGAAHDVAERAASAVAAPDREAAAREVGDLLFAAVTLARNLRVDPEDALRVAGQRFRDRFRDLHRGLAVRGAAYRDVSPQELAELWERTAD
jgi:tetrapyrrole methylase family protein/MazG family protein